MRKTAIYNIVYNRTKKKLLEGETALIQIEILFPGTQKKYLGTNVYVTEKQWDVRTKQVSGSEMDSFYNRKISDFVNKLRKFEMDLNDNGRLLIPSDVNDFINNSSKVGNFYEFMKCECLKRNDITVKTRSSHLTCAERIKTAAIIMFSDLTLQKISLFDQALRAEGKEQPTIHKYHKNIKTYIHLAEKSGLIDYGKNPYLKFTVPHGKHAIRQRLDDAENERLISTEIIDPVIALTRDLFVFSVFTGLAYKDVQGLNATHLREIEGKLWIEGLRKKSGEYYTVYLLPEAVGLIGRYRSTDKSTSSLSNKSTSRSTQSTGATPSRIFPAPELYMQNRLLKIVAAVCGITKPLSTHIARHTCATLLLRKDVSLKVISEMLGHSQISTTEIYAKLEKQTMRKELDRMNDNKY